jgi:hypothetical protein
MARTSAPNSATSQFFINTTDNPSLNAAGTNAGYAVFATVVTSSRAVVDQLYTQGSANPLANQWDIRSALTGSAIAGAFGQVPLVSNFNGDFPIRPSDYLSITSATSVRRAPATPSGPDAIRWLAAVQPASPADPRSA